MIEEITVKNTKNEILDAYYELLEQVKQNKKSNKHEEKAAIDRKTIVAEATNSSAEDIIQGLANLKLIINKSFKELEDQLLAENQKLVNLKQAITICNQELEELYEIKTNTDTLAALLLAQKEKSANFEKTMKERSLAFEQEVQEKRANWKKEQEEFEAAIKEQESLTKKLRAREEEEYVYKRNLTRAKEQDQYLREKQLLETELAEKRLALEQDFKVREQQLLDAEQELAILKEKVQNFPAEKQQAILDTENNITQKLTFKYEYEAKLTQTKVEGESKVYKQIIANLEAKVANLEAQIGQFTERANQANLQVQDIAIKAIDGAARQRYVHLEKGTEITKPTT
jgi:hypothetical protein